MCGRRSVRRYNATGLRVSLAPYCQTPIYNLISRNCFSTIALSLDVTVEGSLGQSRPRRTLLFLLTDPAMWLLALWRSRASAPRLMVVACVQCPSNNTALAAI